MHKYIVLPIILTLTIGCQNTSNPAVELDDSTVIYNSVENREYIKPIIHISPMYPKKEASEGVEGICQVNFDLENKQYGSKPTNITSLNCPNANFFNECKRSMKKWLFKHLDKLNKSESTNGLITTCRFELNRT